jgi:hypothetical protein
MTQSIVMASETRGLQAALERMERAIGRRTKPKRCLQLWSHFVRLRDDNRCVICGSEQGLNAHHILRKSFMPEARFQTGNGITLCADCHRKPHAGFNRRPNLLQPMDAENGEKIEVITQLFRLLLEDAAERGQLRDDFYFISDRVLSKCKMFQGFNPVTQFKGSCLEQACTIWIQTPRNTLNALLDANGMKPKGVFHVNGMNVYYG